MGSYYENISAKTRSLNKFRRLFANPNADPLLASLMRRLPFMRDIIGKLIPPEYLYTKPSLRNYRSNGLQMKLDISNLVDHFIYFSFEHKAISNFVSRLKTDDIVVDVGANIGYTTLLFAKKCTQGKVLSIEPSKELFKTINDHIALNATSNVLALNIGIGEKASIGRLFKIDEFNTGRNRILEDNDKGTNSETIEIRTLDEVVESTALQRINAIKIDVEGYEFKVLQGAERILRTMRPLLMIEVDDHNLKQQKASRQMLFSFLHNLNYIAVDAESMKTIDLTADYENAHFDIICFPKTEKR
jgi:FkbM family methyltransferase